MRFVVLLCPDIEVHLIQVMFYEISYTLGDIDSFPPHTWHVTKNAAMAQEAVYPSVPIRLRKLYGTAQGRAA